MQREYEEGYEDFDKLDEEQEFVEDESQLHEVEPEKDSSIVPQTTEEVYEDNEEDLEPPEEEPAEKPRSKEKVDEDESEEDKPAKQKHDIRKIIAEEKRKNYQALSAISELQKKIELLEKERAEARAASYFHYGDKIEGKVEQSKRKLEHALDSGDNQAIIAAQEEMAQAVSERDRFKFEKAAMEWNQQQQQTQQVPEEQFYLQQVKQANVNQWASENSWYYPESEDYDPELASQMQSWLQQYDNNLYMRGLQDYIFTDEYAQQAREAARRLKASRRQPNGDLNMKRSRTPVAPVRTGRSGESGSARRSSGHISNIEMEMLRNMGAATPEKIKEYLKNRELDRKEQQEKYFGSDRYFGGRYGR